ncbi:MAG: nuclear transport factor 2 family protein [Xanthomonadales bacterium]|nr:nuclear transport factor 2 family protein [Xanthomonadales bacterium]
MIRISLLFSACVFMFANVATGSEEQSLTELQQQVKDTEQAFADTMAQRDFEQFVSFLADETIFFVGDTPLRGKQAVTAAWKAFYDTSAAPFSWAPGQVEVLESGTLALSSGPVYDPQGKRVATFTSIWRLEAPGKWRIVFDKGNEVCNCPDAKPESSAGDS